MSFPYIYFSKYRNILILTNLRCANTSIRETCTKAGYDTHPFDSTEKYIDKNTSVFLFFRTPEKRLISLLNGIIFKYANTDQDVLCEGDYVKSFMTREEREKYLQYCPPDNTEKYEYCIGIVCKYFDLIFKKVDELNDTHWLPQTSDKIYSKELRKRSTLINIDNLNTKRNKEYLTQMFSRTELVSKKYIYPIKPYVTDEIRDVVSKYFSEDSKLQENCLRQTFLTCEFSAIKSPSLSIKNTGLGNVLFQVAATMGLGKKYNKEIFFEELPKLCSVLSDMGYKHETTIFRKLPVKFTTENFTILSEIPEQSETFDKELEEKIEHNKINIKLTGYLQSHIYFDDYKEEILELFSIDEKSMLYISSNYSSIFTDTSVSLHVRQNYGGSIKYISAYYMKAMKYLQNKFSSCVFYIFSDDINWCKNNLQGPNIVYVENNPDYIDLWLMSLCKHNVISHSTLSWWGAYLNRNKDKVVIYPEDALRIYYGKLYPTPVNIKRKNEHFFDEWICMKVTTM